MKIALALYAFAKQDELELLFSQTYNVQGTENIPVWVPTMWRGVQ